MEPQNDFLVGIDSDGCVFDTMETKHKECFIPVFIDQWNLQGVSKYARETAEFVNLYSKSRGINRFPALIEELDRLRRRPEVQARGVDVPRPEGLIKWMESESKLGNPALEKAVQENSNPDLEHALRWSIAVNDAVTKLVRNVPPFPFVRQCLQKLDGKADALVVSATPHEALLREWDEHNLDGMVAEICGQEIGTKAQMLGIASKYPENHALMMGDAPGDYKAAVANNCLFYPINPGAEDASWQRFYEEGIDRFLSGQFVGDYQKSLLDEFDSYLPENPPWEVAQ